LDFRQGFFELDLPAIITVINFKCLFIRTAQIKIDAVFYSGVDLNIIGREFKFLGHG
jgi:hypothetical protein